MSAVTEAECFFEYYVRFLLDKVGADEYKWCIEISAIDNKARYGCVIKGGGTDVIDELYDMLKEFLKKWRKRGIEVSLRKRNDGIYVKAEVELEDVCLLMDALFSCLPLFKSWISSYV